MPETLVPEFLAPMLLTLVKEPFDSPDWIFEPKLDGYRAIAVIDATANVRIWSRNHLPLEQKFPTVPRSSVGCQPPKLNRFNSVCRAKRGLIL
jgi:bifunctional non-homologous end joining protein LigD